MFNVYVTDLRTVGIAERAGRTLLQVMFATGVPAFYISGRLVDRLPAVPYLLAVPAAVTGCILILLALGGLWSLAALSAVIGYAIHGIFPAVDAYLRGSLPDHHRASAYSAYGAGMMVIQAPGSLLVGLLRDAGVAFATIFEWMGAGLVVLLLLHADGRLPETARARARGYVAVQKLIREHMLAHHDYLYFGNQGDNPVRDTRIVSCTSGSAFPEAVSNRSQERVVSTDGSV